MERLDDLRDQGWEPSPDNPIVLTDMEFDEHVTIAVEGGDAIQEQMRWDPGNPSFFSHLHVIAQKKLQDDFSAGTGGLRLGRILLVEGGQKVNSSSVLQGDATILHDIGPVLMTLVVVVEEVCVTLEQGRRWEKQAAIADLAQLGQHCKINERAIMATSHFSYHTALSHFSYHALVM